MKTQYDSNKPETLISLEKEKFEFCKEIYAEQLKQKERLSNKTAFLTSLVTVFVGALGGYIGNYDEYEAIKQSHISPEILILSIILFCVAIFLTFIGIFNAIKNRSYYTNYSKYLSKDFFSSESEYFNPYTPLNVYNSLGHQISLAIENNAKINNNKAKWLDLAWYSVLFNILLVAIFVFYTLINTLLISV